MGDCMYGCGAEVDPQCDYEQVVGFRHKRSSGGANQITQAHPTGRWACRTCVDRLRAGTHPQQQPLWSSR